MRPQEGKLLVAQPGIDDKHFNHSVIMLIDYAKEQESLGIVLNRQTNLTLSEVLDGDKFLQTIPLYSGGPVARDRLLYLHTLGPLFRGAKEVSEGLYLGGDFDDVIDYIGDGHEVDGMIRFFIGYSGWSPSQLDDEIKEGSWAVADAIAPTQMLTLSDNALWHETVRSMGDRFKAWRYSPLNPLLN